MAPPHAPGATALAAAAALAAPLAASGGLRLARATDPALTRISAALRPSSVGLASGLAVGIVLAASPSTLAGYAVCACLAASAAADRDQYVLPDALTLAAVGLALAFKPFTPVADRLGLVAAGAVTYGLGTAFALVMRAWRGRTAFGQGDVKLLAAFAVILPGPLLPAAILIGSASALAFYFIPPRGFSRVVPFGLHLVIGAGAALASGGAFRALLGGR